MSDTYTYTKKWKMFGRQAQFEDTQTKILGMVPPDPNQADDYVRKDPSRILLSNIPDRSTQTVSKLNRKIGPFQLSFSNSNINPPFYRSTLNAFPPSPRV